MKDINSLIHSDFIVLRMDRIPSAIVPSHEVATSKQQTLSVVNLRVKVFRFRDFNVVDHNSIQIQGCLHDSTCNSSQAQLTELDGSNNIITQDNKQEDECSMSPCIDFAAFINSVIGDGNTIDQQTFQNDNCTDGSTCTNNSISSVDVVGSIYKITAISSESNDCRSGSECSNSGSVGCIRKLD